MEANKPIYKINAALSTSLPLLGVGDECIIDTVSGEIIARFYNGNLVSLASPNSQPMDGQQFLETQVAA